ncbi:MAG: alanine racemase, partial [Eggerthellaceae bacterium]|nr:alanine racemase [Eggerthellaceae bacterium]
MEAVKVKDDSSSFLSEEGRQALGKDEGIEALDAIPETDRRWAWVEISRSAIQHNIMLARRAIGHEKKLLCVVKADAYGHGAVEVARIALNTGADYLAVATVDEGIELRRALIGGPIMLLAQPPKESIPVLLAYNIEPTIYYMNFAVTYAEAAYKLGKKAPYHLAINTGMNRIGLEPKDLPDFLKNISFHRALDIRGTYTHFATADDSNYSAFESQLRAFNMVLDFMENNDYPTGIIHA